MSSNLPARGGRKAAEGERGPASKGERGPASKGEQGSASKGARGPASKGERGPASDGKRGPASSATDRTGRGNAPSKRTERLAIGPEVSATEVSDQETARSRSRRGTAGRLRSAREARRAIVYRELLGPPIGLRQGGSQDVPGIR